MDRRLWLPVEVHRDRLGTTTAAIPFALHSPIAIFMTVAVDTCYRVELHKRLAVKDANGNQLGTVLMGGDGSSYSDMIDMLTGLCRATSKTKGTGRSPTSSGWRICLATERHQDI